MNDNETFEDYLKRTLPKKAKSFIYEREHPFLSKKRLNRLFGNIAFFQFSNEKDPICEKTFSVRLVSNCINENKVKDILSNYTGKSRPFLLWRSHLMRFGYLKCLFSEQFDPFQETIKRILELKDIKHWITDMLSKKKSHNEISISFFDGKPNTIFTKESIIFL